MCISLLGLIIVSHLVSTYVGTLHWFLAAGRERQLEMDVEENDSLASESGAEVSSSNP
jgi:hypothetical protein